MTKEEVFNLLSSNPVLYLATVEEDQPRVRGMLLYKADESGITFHTGAFRDVYKQVLKNPKVELCFNSFKDQTQIRVSGELEIVDDRDLKDEIANHPSRGFLTPWKESIDVQEFYDTFIVFRLKNGTATIWSMAKNYEPKEEIKL